MILKEKYTTIDKIMIAMIVLFSFYYLEPFFIWKTFAGGFFRNLFGIIPYRTLFGLMVVALFVCCYSRNGTTRKKAVLCAMVFFTAIFTVCLAGGAVNTKMFSLAWLPYCVVVAFILLPLKNQKKSYEVFVILFAITLVLPIIYYILSHLGINVPYSRLESAEEIKVIREKYYKLYPLAAQLTSQIDPTWQELRMSGIFDESGRIGTVASLILASERYKIKRNWKNTVILIGGFLSFSLAFYAITVIYYFIICWNKKNAKNIAIILGLIIGYIVFMSISFTNSNLTQFQKRLEFTSEGLSGDNRTNETFDELMDEFYHSDYYSLLFGRGDGAIGEIQAERNIDGSSYKSMIFNFGFVGFGISVVWLFLYAFFYMKKRGSDKTQIVAVLVVYLANMYQRPSVFNMGYMLIMFGGFIKATQNSPGVKRVEGKKRRSNFSVRCCNTLSNV